MKIILAGGGTGGHLFPGIAVAREFQKRDPKVKILFVGTRKGIESTILPKEKLPLKTILSSGLKGKLSWHTLLALIEIPIALLQSFWILVSFKPKLVLGFGGYVAGPFLLMAWFLRIPTAIQEQNLLPGSTNRILGKIVDKIFVSFEKSIDYFPANKVIFTGNPIREENFKNKDLIKDSRFNVFIFGGSRGARSINNAMLEALDFLSEVKDSLHFIHQTGNEQFETVRLKYDAKNMSSEVTQFVFNMSDYYQRSNLVICRAGASTIAELTALGRAAILIPFPFAVNDHQQWNAEFLAKQNAALILKDSELTGKKLAALIIELMRHPEHINEMERNSARMAKRNAGKNVVDHCYKMFA